MGPKVSEGGCVDEMPIQVVHPEWHLHHDNLQLYIFQSNIIKTTYSAVLIV
jgi:hypothetical protein